MTDLKRELLDVVQAVLPIAGVVLLLQIFLISMPWTGFARFGLGVVLVTAGLLLFLQGVKIGLLPMGEAVGAELPKRGSLPFLLVSAFILGLTVTMAEPDVWVLSGYVDTASGGAVSKYALVVCVALGVAIFVSLAMLRIVLNVPIAYILAAGYCLILVLSFFTPADFVPVSFDAGVVTTGPMTVTFVMAIALGLADALEGRSAVQDGFGLIALVALAPILSVMSVGLLLTTQSKRKGTRNE
ncbi:DUF1538 domain-containing protein [Desulfovermiculus halophilus]|uniref:DUF1538 domain-containing protein n=1 Tax=Desulfovermiculus halophilus TaxID=339722 RepID=UPI0006881887|nr:DUF1538 domain-containing protein [Desulfovermiculus halophilus]